MAEDELKIPSGIRAQASPQTSYAVAVEVVGDETGGLFDSRHGYLPRMRRLLGLPASHHSLGDLPKAVAPSILGLIPGLMWHKPRRYLRPGAPGSTCL